MLDHTKQIGNMAIALFTRATSSCSFRIRIALALKQLQYESVHTKHADQHTQHFMSMNPQKLVPLLVNGEA